MADLPHEAFGGKTVLEAADIPNMDALARKGELGLVDTVTPGFPPGSDVTNLAILGCDPRLYYTGRAPLEAASIGVTLAGEDVAFRCNLVTLEDRGFDVLMGDYSAGHIATPDAKVLIEFLDEHFRSEGVRFYTGKSYRHLCVLGGIDPVLETTPPHDIMGQPIRAHLPKGEGAEKIRDLMTRSRPLLAQHSHNRGLKTPVDQIWLWGQGRAPTIPKFEEAFGLRGAVVSAVDLIKGIGKYMGLEVIEVPGATGFLDTNYAGKVDAAAAFLECGGDFVFVHVEAADECGHNGIPEDKKRAVEDFDAKVVGPILRRLAALGEYRLLILPDHYTPLSTRTHLGRPVPFILATSSDRSDIRPGGYSEQEAKATGLFIDSGMALLKLLLG